MQIENDLPSLDPKANAIASLLKQPLGEALLSAHLHQMESVGSTWIALMPLSHMSEAIYEHLKEEMNHAQMLLRVSTSLRSALSSQEARIFNSAASVSFAATVRYLRELSLAVLRRTSERRRDLGEARWLANYYGLSYLLERRVMKIYPTVVRLASDTEFAKTAKRILQEERGHLQHVLQGCRPYVESGVMDLCELGAIDDRLYDVLLSEMKEAK